MKLDIRPNLKVNTLHLKDGDIMISETSAVQLTFARCCQSKQDPEWTWTAMKHCTIEKSAGISQYDVLCFK